MAIRHILSAFTRDGPAPPLGAGLTRPPAIAHPMGGGMVGAHVDTPAPTMWLLNGAVSRI